jgi:hypothetical protein
MDLKISKVVDRGTLKSEYVQIEVLKDTNLHYYLVADSTYGANGQITNKHRHFFAFATKAVKKGDFILLYTRSGVDKSYPNKANTTTHEIFWDLKTSVWNNTGDVVVLYYAPNWDTHQVN